MSMHTYVRGFKGADDPKYAKFKAIWDACKAADVDPPKQVGDYFDWEHRNTEHGMPVEIPVHEWSDSSSLSDGFDVILSEIPKDVTVIRFVNSY